MNNFPPIGESAEKKEQVESMFDAIAPRYDMLNRILSLGIDQGWRRKAIKMIEPFQPKRILDIATGTADLALLSMRLKPSHVTGIDLSEEMLEIGRKKVSEAGYSGQLDLLKGDAENLPFENKSFDAALAAFGVRNFGNLRAGLAEVWRVLEPGAPFVVLEFSHPKAFPVKQGYELYSRHLLPRIGRLVSKNDGAYKYLPESVAAFPDGEDFMSVMREVGFIETQWKPLTFGVASLYMGIA